MDAINSLITPQLAIPIDGDSIFMLLYLGPETMMPLASILAGIVGFLLIFWRLILKGLKSIFSLISTPFKKKTFTDSPEFDSDETTDL